MGGAEERETEEARPGGTKWRRWGLWAVIVALALLSSTTYHLQIREGGRALAIALAAFLDDAFAGRVDVGHIEALGATELVLHDVRITSAAGEVLAHAERVHLWVDATTLGDGALVIHQLGAETARVSMKRQGDELALVEALRPRDARGRERRGSIVIEHLVLEDAEITDLPRGFEVVGLGFEGRLDGGAAPSLSFDSLEAELRREGQSLGRIDRARGQLAAEGASEAELRIAGEESFVELRAALVRTGGRVSSYRADATFDLAEELLERLWTSDAALVLGSKLAGELSFEGSDTSLEGEATMTTDGGALTVRAVRLDDAIEMRASSDGLDLSEILDGLALDTIGGEIVARVGDADEAHGQRSLEIEASDVRYGEHVVPEATLAGILGDGFFEIERVAVPAWTGEEGELVVGGGFGFDRSVDLTVHADLPGLAADENVQRRAPGLRGRVEAELVLKVTAGDEATMDLDGRLAIRDATLGGARIAHLEVDGTAEGEARRPRVELRITGRRIVSESLALRSIRATVDGGPETYALRGDARLDEGRALSVSLSGARGEDGLDVTGTARLDGLLAGPVALAIDGLRFADDGTIGLAELVASGAGIDARASGTYRQDDISELEIDLRSLNLGAASGSRLARGDGRGTLRASGTIARPELTLEATLANAALGPLSAPEVRLSGGISAADRVVRVEASGDFEGYGRLALDARGRLGAGPTLERRLSRTDWGADLELRGVPLTLAMLLSPDLPPWDGTVDATARVEGRLPTPDIHLDAAVAGFAAMGSDEIDADVRFDFGAPHADAVVGLRDRRGPLATFTARATVEPAALRMPLDRRRITRNATWSLDFSVPRRRIDHLPRPLSRDVALSAAVEGALNRRAGGSVAGDARIVLSRYDEVGDGGHCRHGGLSTVTLDVDVGERTTVRVATNTTGRDQIEGEVSAETPIDAWIAEGLPDVPPPLALSARADALDLATIPGLCERAAGTVDIEADGSALLTESPRGRLSLRSDDLRLGDGAPFAASLNARTDGGAVRARIGVTSGPHRGRLRVGAPLRFDGLVPRRPREIDVEELVYRRGGGSAELSGTARLAGEGSSGGVVLDGAIRRLPLSRRGEVAGRLTARAHVEASYGSELRQLVARFTETSFVLPPRPRLSRAERRRQREERRRARQGAERRRRPLRGDGDVRTEIVLDATERFWVRRDDMRLELSTRLLVDVIGGEPRLRGRVNVHGGRMGANIGHYDIEEGYIAFWGGGREPEMVLRGTFEGRRGRKRRVTLHGPLGATEVRIE